MPLKNQLRGYLWFSRWMFPRSYSIKFLAVAFLGIHVPLIVYVAYLAMRDGLSNSLPSILVVLAATLLGTGLTLWVQYLLLAPLRLTSRALGAYRFQREIWPLPTAAPDEAGALMRDTYECLQDLDRLMNLKDTLATGIAHDFRSPLSVVSLKAELLLMDEYLPEPVKEGLTVIKRTSDLQLRHVSDLINAVVNDTRSARINFHPAAVNALWEEVHTLIAPLAVEKRVELRIRPTEAKVGADRGRILQVLNNLVANALRATPSGGWIELRAERRDPGFWELHVRDNGPGLDSDALLQCLRTEAAADGGANPIKLGLGLRMCSALLQLHASRLEVQSAFGQGADFYFRLPIA